jgi:hypothetical protein
MGVALSTSLYMGTTTDRRCAAMVRVEGVWLLGRLTREVGAVLIPLIFVQ